MISLIEFNTVLDTIQNKVNNLTKSIEDIPSYFSSKCNVHVGDGMITTFNEIKLLEDGCSDVLQRELNNSWRIIAVCVQPDQGRPDYILGRYNPDLGITNSTEAKKMKNTDIEYNNRVAREHTGPYWHTEETARKSANHLTKRNGRYYTYIKGTPHSKGNPKECWAVTDRWSDNWLTK